MLSDNDPMVAEIFSLISSVLCLELKKKLPISKKRSLELKKIMFHKSIMIDGRDGHSN